MTAPTELRYHIRREDGKEVHRARMVAIEDKYGTVQWRCVQCSFGRPAKDGRCLPPSQGRGRRGRAPV
ncbi:hypothetical protein BH20CHL5_BH20CHL5_14320 [soil metagenome]